jgi:hypothetical protein
MTLSLAKYLVEHNVVSAGHVDDALQRQVLFGGSLGTNLLELNAIDENKLTNALSEIHHHPVANSRLISQYDDRIANLFPQRLIQKHQIAPVCVIGRSVHVIAATRIHPIVVEEIGFMLSLSVKTHLVCQPRLQKLQQEWFNIKIDSRFLVLLERMGEYRVEQATIRPEVEQKEDPFKTLGETTTKIDSSKVKEALDTIETEERQKQKLRQKARSGQIKMEEASDICLQAVNRDEIVDVILRYSRQFVPFVALFIISDDFIIGWDAVGIKKARERIRSIRVSTGVSSILNMVLQTQSFYLGPVPDSIGNNDLFRTMGRNRPRDAMVVPIMLKERMIGLLYGDSGRRSIKSSNVAELLVFVSRLSAIFENLIRRNKAKAEKIAKERPIQPKEEEKHRPSSLAESFEDLESIEESTEALPSQETAPAIPQEASTETSTPADTLESLKFDPSITDSTLAPADHVPELPELEDQQTLKEAGFLDDDISSKTPAVKTSELDIGADESKEVKDEMHPDETRVVFEDIGEEDESAVSIVENDQATVIVNTESEFVPKTDDSLDSKPKPIPLVNKKKPVEKVEEKPQITTSPSVSVDASLLETPSKPDLNQEQKPTEHKPEEVDHRSIDSLVEQLDGDQQAARTMARQELNKIGTATLDVVMTKFPGKLSFDIRSSYDHMPPISEHSELLRFLVELGADASQAIDKKLEDPDPTIRYYAVKWFGEVYCPRFVGRISERLYDRDALIRLTSIDVLQTYKNTTAYKEMLTSLREQIKSEDPNKQAIAAALVGNFKDGESLPLLVNLIKSKNKMVSRAAIESLSYITKQDFGTNERKWTKWWKAHRDLPRIQWLIDGLRSKNRDIRFSSSKELSQLTKEYFGYYFDSNKNEREQSIKLWEQWWEKHGKQQNLEI